MPAGTAASTPAQTVTSALDEVLASVSACRFLLATDPAALRELADARVRPLLDVLFAGQIILGKWWPEASAAERRAFADGLYGSLANEYAPSLLLLTPGTVTVHAAPAATGSDAVVPIVVRVPGYAPVTVSLQLRRTADRWRVYDGRVEDLSPVLQLRERFSEEIRRDGLVRVIDRLEAEAARNRASSPITRKCLAAGSGS
jgi:phospholipid transport system substrate-binding protein